MNLSRCCLFSQLCTCSHKVYVCSLKVDICSLTVYTLSRSSLTVKSLFVFLSFYHTFFLPFSFHCVPNTASLLTVLQTLEFVNSCAYIYIYLSTFTRTNKHSDTPKRAFSLLTVADKLQVQSNAVSCQNLVHCLPCHRQRGFMYRDSKEICCRKWAFWVMLKNLSAI